MSYVALKDEFGFPLFDENGEWITAWVDDNPTPIDDGWAVCDFSGFKTKPHDLVKNWDGAMVGRRFVDKRNPQDFVKGVKERPFINPRPESVDVFLEAPVRAEDL